MKKTDHHSSHSDHDAKQEHPHQATSAGVKKPAKADKAPDAHPVDLQAEINKYRDQAMRTAADLENYRKRMIREKEDAVRYANSSLLEKLLPILDNFELGLAAAKNDTNANTANIINGLAMVQRQLSEFLKDHGVEPIDAQEKPFDPKLHEAIGHEAHSSIPEGHVLRQMRRGYRLGDRLIRPASVVVSKGAETA